MPTDQPLREQRGSLVATAPQIGSVSAVLNHTPPDTWELRLQTQAPLAAGSILPLKLRLVATGEEISTVFRVVGQIVDGRQVGLVVSLSTDDSRLQQTLAGWLVAGPPADQHHEASAIVGGSRGKAAASPMQDRAAAGGIRGSGVASPARAGPGAGAASEPAAEGPELNHAIVGVSQAPVAPALDAARLAAREVVRREANEAALSRAEAALREAARQRAEAALREAVSAERRKDWATAFEKLEVALAANPTNAVQLHLRLAKLAAGPIGDLLRAKQHATEALRLAPESKEARAILQDIDTRATASVVAPPDKTKALRGLPSIAFPSRFRLLIAVVSLLGLVGAGGWMAWSFLIPHGPRPKEIFVTSVSDILPASRVQLHRASLFVTATEAWNQMAPQAKKEALEALAGRARRDHSVSRVVVISADGRLLGTAEQGRVRVLR